MYNPLTIGNIGGEILLNEKNDKLLVPVTKNI